VGQDGLEEGVERLVGGPEPQGDDREGAEVAGREGGVDALEGAGVVEFDARDAGVRGRRADDPHPDLAGPVDVVDEVTEPAQQPGILQSPDRLSDDGHH
jgi:hypothetical protein